MGSQGFIFAVVLASISGAAYYILYGPSPGRSTRKKSTPPGLINIGKSCFLNSVLQAFAACRIINNWLSNIFHENESIIETDESKSVLLTVFKLLKYLNNLNDNNGVRTPASTSDVLKALYAHRWVINNEEQDAHEMFHVLTNTMDEEVRSKYLTPALNIKCNKQPSGILSRSCDNLPTVEKMHTKLPFRGLMASKLRCESCSYKCPLNFDTFDSLSLPIPENRWPHIMLQDCLRHYMMPERVSDVECERCSGAGYLHCQSNENAANKKSVKKSTFIKQLTIGKLPNLLCIHIQRMAWLNNGMPTKRYEHVIFPRYLNMSEFRMGYQKPKKLNNLVKPSNSSLVGGCGTHEINSSDDKEISLPTTTISTNLSLWSMANEPLMYSLRSVIVHLGDVISGHFVTYRQGPIGCDQKNRWYMCSDSTVREVTLEQVLKCDAYMLFYERTEKGL